MNHAAAPLWEAMDGYASRHVHRFHLPGHKGKGPTLEPLAGRLRELDLTELPGLDDLHAPTGPIAAAQELAAEFFGADRTFFLVQGCTVGIQAMVMAALAPGEKMLLPRYVHRAVLGAMVLGGVIPVWLPSIEHSEWSFPLGVALSTVEEALDREKVGAILLPHPVYQGVSSDLKRIVQVAHRRGVAVLVDEAHGTHFGLDGRLPTPALAAGADAVVQGTHKTGGALTQGAMLHLRGRRLDPERMRRALDFLETSSPSYILLASLDLARRRLATSGSCEQASIMDLVGSAREDLATRGVRLLTESDLPFGFELDLCRLTISTRGTLWSGSDMAQRVAANHRVQVEYAGVDHLVAVMTLADTPADILALVEALTGVARESEEVRGPTATLSWPGTPPQVLTPRDAAMAPAGLVPLELAIGEVAAEAVAVYPPGVPVLWPGEAVTLEVVDYLREALANGLRIQGIGATGGITVVGRRVSR